MINFLVPVTVNALPQISELEGKQGMFVLPDGSININRKNGTWMVINKKSDYAGVLKPADNPVVNQGDAKWWWVGAGTYQNAGNLIIEKQGIISYDGVAWKELELDVPLSNNIRIWVAQPYNSNDQVIKDFVQYIAPDGALATDIPGVSSKWFSLGVNSDDFLQISTKTHNLANPIDFKGVTLSGTVGNTVVTTNAANWVSLVYESALENTVYRAKGFANGVLTAPTNVIYYTTANNIIISAVTGTQLASANGIFTTPAGTKKIFMLLGNIVGVGSNPSDSILKDQFQLVLGNEDKPFLKYGYIVKYDTIPNIDQLPKIPEIENSVINLKEIEDGFTNNYNLANPTKMVSGVWDINGNFIPNQINNLALQKTKTKPNTWYALLGGGALANYSRFVHFKADNTVISTTSGTNAGNFPIKFKTPLEGDSIGITVGYNSDPALLQAYKNTFMLVELASEFAEIPPYVPYGKSIKESALPSLTNVISNNEVVKTNSANVSEILKQYDSFDLYDGAAYTALNNEYVLNSVGDFVEIEFKYLDNVQFFATSLGLIGKGSGANTFGYYGVNTIYLRDNAGGNWKIFNVTESPYSIIKLRLEINSDNRWEVFINSISKGSVDRTGSFNIKNIAKAYFADTTPILLKSVKIKVGSNLTELKDLSTYTGSVNVKKQLVQKSTGGGNSSITYANTYVSFSPTMYNGKEGFNVFVKLQGSTNKYVRYTLYRNYDLSELVYMDYFKLNGCDVYSYNGTNMSPIGVNVLIGSENEFTMLEQGRADHSGGVHGDEISTLTRFRINGKIIENLTTPFTLLPCEVFDYQIVSTIHSTATIANPTVPIAGHPVIADHIKTVVLGSERVTIDNIVIFKQAVQMIRAYTGLVCIAKPFAAKGYTDNGVYGVFDQLDNSQTNDMYGHTFYGSGDAGGCEISSKVVSIYKPSKGKNCESDYKDFSAMWITDRTSDSKYYRILGTTNAPFTTTEVGERWHLQCSIKLFGI